MVLLNDVVEILDLAELNAGIMFGFMLRVVAFDRRRVGAALVDRDFSGVPSCLIALRKKRSAALPSRLAVSGKSTVAPVLSTARYKYLQAPFTFT